MMRAREPLTDTKGAQCPACGSLRIQYFHGRGQAWRKCARCNKYLPPGAIDIAPDVTRRIKTTGEWRAWWSRAYDNLSFGNMRTPADEYTEGRRAAEREIRDDRWTPELARNYLKQVGAPRPGDEFDRGFMDVVKELAAKQSCGCASKRYGNTLHLSAKQKELARREVRAAAHDALRTGANWQADALHRLKAQGFTFSEAQEIVRLAEKHATGGRWGNMHQKPPMGDPKQIGSHRFSIRFYTQEIGKSGGNAYSEEWADDFDQARRRGYLKLAAHPGLGTFHVFDWRYPAHARENLPWIGRQQDLRSHSIDALLTMPRKHGEMRVRRS